MTNPEVRIWAKYFVQNNSTLRKTANVFGISKSKLHSDFKNKLDKNTKLYWQVEKLLEKNKKERHIRGGLATKNKYKAKKK